MVASQSTIAAIYAVLLKHVSARKMDAIIKDLEQVAGNKSFRDTVSELIRLHRYTIRGL
jgi:hypothetical protein